MNGFVRVASVTPPLKLGNVDYNTDKIAELIDAAKAAGVSLAVFPEMCISGYTMGDLFNQSALIDQCEGALKRLAEHAKGIAVVVGLPVRYMGKLYNVAAVLSCGRVIAAVPKINLPNYGEFYEARNFASGRVLREIALCGQQVPCREGLVFCDKNNPDFTFGVEVCEDMWVAQSPSIRLVRGGARIICNPSASVEVVGKAEFRRLLIKGHSSKLTAGYIYADCGTGESTTDSVFAGHRLIAEDGTLLCESELFTEGMTVTEIDLERIGYSRRQANTFTSEFENVTYIEFESNDFSGDLLRRIEPLPFVPAGAAGREELVLRLQSEGLKRRLKASGSDAAVVGLSGGLDSALALLVAVRAAGEKNVIAVTMPCFGTGERTLKNARLLTDALKVQLREIEIAGAVRAHFADIGHDESNHSSVYENAQARERTQVLMDIANDTRGIVVGTGDMSELALGWTTYNGDQMSNYGVNASVPKTLVKHLVKYEAQRIGGAAGKALEDILNTEISPELLPPVKGKISQKTEDIIGRYEYHDFFLYYAVRWGFSPKKVAYLAEQAFGKDKREQILKAMKVFYTRFFSQQFKRSCMPDGVKVGTVSLSPRADLRMPSDADAALWLKQLSEIK